MSIQKDECWGLIPARGGSKSIPLKNIAPFAGRPLIDYNIFAAKHSKVISRIICSTDSDQIAAQCQEHKVDIHQRPEELGTDNAAVIDVIIHTLSDIEENEGVIPEFVALLQPTSPFLLPIHIDDCVSVLRKNPDAGSAQTVITCLHNHHALNQRLVIEGEVTFRFAEERAIAYNKQSKPKHWLFGNLVVFRVEHARSQKAVFAIPSLSVQVDYYYGFDADGPEDFRLGEVLYEKEFVKLPHMN